MNEIFHEEIRGKLKEQGIDVGPELIWGETPPPPGCFRVARIPLGKITYIDTTPIPRPTLTADMILGCLRYRHVGVVWTDP